MSSFFHRHDHHMSKEPSPIIEAEAPMPSGTETIDDLLFGPLPESHRDPAIVRARQTILATFALIAADRGTDIVLCRDQGKPDGPAREAFIDSIVELDRSWRAYMHDTRRRDAGDVVRNTIVGYAGGKVAEFVAESLRRLRAYLRLRDIREALERANNDAQSR
jgi:hypothetical protein